MADMTGKVALVTGAGSGMGRSMAPIFAKRGAAVVIADINVEGGTAAAEEIRAKGGQAKFVRTDVPAEDDVRAAVQSAVSSYGRLDFAVNNAGYDGDVRPLVEQSSDTFRRVVEVNLLGVFFGLKYQIPVMVGRGGGAIVNAASIIDANPLRRLGEPEEMAEVAVWLCPPGGLLRQRCGIGRGRRQDRVRRLTLRRGDADTE